VPEISFERVADRGPGDVGPQWKLQQFADIV